MNWKDIELIQTCGACPEQYDAYIDGVKIGYLRLRYGHFRAEYLGETVFKAYPNGDGCFDYEEREKYLKKARKALIKAHKKEHCNKYKWGDCECPKGECRRGLEQ